MLSFPIKPEIQLRTDEDPILLSDNYLDIKPGPANAQVTLRSASLLYGSHSLQSRNSKDLNAQHGTLVSLRYVYVFDLRKSSTTLQISSGSTPIKR